VKRTATLSFIGALWLAENTAAYGTSMIYAAIKPLIASFGDPVTVGWLVTGFLLVGGAAAAVAARLGDLYGRRRILLWLLAISALGCAMGGASSRFAIVLAGRGLQGLALAILPLCLGLVRENVRPERMPLAVGLVISAASAGTVLGIVLGGVLTDQLGWHAIFYAGTGFGLLSMLGVWAFVPPSAAHHKGEPLDLLSAVLSVPAIAGLLFVISSGRSWGWGDPRLLGIATASLLLIALWIHHSLRHREPLIDLRLFAQRNVLVVNIAYMLIALGSFQVTLIFSLLLQAPTWSGAGLGVPATAAGLAILPSTVLACFVAPFTGLLVERFGGRTMMIAGGILSTIGWMCGVFGHGTVTAVMLNLCIMTTGGVILYSSGPTVLIGAVPPERTSEATGMMIVLRSMAMAAGAQIVAVLLATDTVADPARGAGRYPSESAFMLAMLAVAATCVLATLVAMALPRRPRDPRLVSAHA
jgi:MFS family permease